MLCAWCGWFSPKRLICEACWESVFEKLDSIRIVANNIPVLAGIRWIPNQTLLMPLVNRLKWLSNAKEAGRWVEIKWAKLAYFLKLQGYSGQQIVWVPVPSTSNPKRGLLLSKSFAELLGGKVMTLFEKVNDIEFKRKSKSERAGLVVNALKPIDPWPEDLSPDSYIILVDDIITSGQTIANLSFHLRMKGYGSILGVSWFNRILQVENTSDVGIDWQNFNFSVLVHGFQ